MSTKIKKVALAYSGGLDTSVILTWLRERYDCEVVAVAVDVGQGAEELEGLEEKAMATGACAVHVLDMRERFVRDCVYPALRGAALYEGTYLLGTALARPVITEGLVEVADLEGCDALAHGATGKGNDQVRFEMSAFALKPELRMIAPWREWDLRGRKDCIAYAKARNIPIIASVEKPYSMDRNLLHLSFEGGVLEDPWREPDREMFKLTRDPMDAPDTPEYVEIGFKAGTPVSVNGEDLGPIALLETLNGVAGTHGVGRIDIVENRFVGMKSRGVYETPGGTLLWMARRAVETLTMDRELMSIRDDLIPRYASLIYNGLWHAPERYAVQALIDEATKDVEGTARLKLYKGGVSVVGRKAPRSLYAADFVTFEADDVYNQGDAEGFIKLTALRMRIRALSGWQRPPTTAEDAAAKGL